MANVSMKGDIEMDRLEACLGSLETFVAADAPHCFALCQVTISKYLNAHDPDRGTQTKALRVLQLAFFTMARDNATSDLVLEDMATRLRSLNAFNDDRRPARRRRIAGQSVH